MPTSFSEKGYTKSKTNLSNDLIHFITKYVFYEEMQNTYNLRDDQVKGSYGKYSDPAMETILTMLQPTIESITGLSIQPTYSYYRIYRAGQELKKHVDRPSCEISATLCFGYSNDIWPIYMNGECISLLPGEMAVYRGCEIPHWREPLLGGDNVWHVQGFFHYIDINGKYLDYIFDQRPSLGHIENHLRY